MPSVSNPGRKSEGIIDLALVHVHVFTCWSVPIDRAIKIVDSPLENGSPRTALRDETRNRFSSGFFNFTGEQESASVKYYVLPRKSSWRLGTGYEHRSSSKTFRSFTSAVAVVQSVPTFFREESRWRNRIGFTSQRERIVRKSRRNLTLWNDAVSRLILVEIHPSQLVYVVSWLYVETT